MEDLIESPVETLWVAASSSLGDSDRGRKLLAAVRERNVPVAEFDDRDFATVAGTEATQGVIAVAGIPETALDALATGADGLVLVLDAVQDPGNFGTLVRSAEALGALGIVVLPGTVDPWNPKTVRASAGSSFRLPIVQADAAAAVRGLKDAGYRLVGAEGGGGEPQAIRADRIALVMGNEGAGLSDEMKSAVDELVGIPIRGRAESLNVAAAGAILLWELVP